MKATPLFRADLEEYRELGTVVQAALRNVLMLMEVHDIKAVRRYRKDGVFDRPYVKDSVSPLGVTGVPNTVAAARDAVGTALLDYLEAIGISGLSLDATQEEIAAIEALWNPPATYPAEQAAKDPMPVADAHDQPGREAPVRRKKAKHMSTDKLPETAPAATKEVSK